MLGEDPEFDESFTTPGWEEPGRGLQSRPYRLLALLWVVEVQHR